jgi:hypothetical protein
MYAPRDATASGEFYFAALPPKGDFFSDCALEGGDYDSS